jgi:hypothetical protein
LLLSNTCYWEMALCHFFAILAFSVLIWLAIFLLIVFDVICNWKSILIYCTSHLLHKILLFMEQENWEKGIFFFFGFLVVYSCGRMGEWSKAKNIFLFCFFELLKADNFFMAEYVHL